MSDSTNKPLVLITYKIPTKGDAFKELTETCEVRFHEGSDFMTKDELLRAVPGVDGVLIQSEDTFDRQVIETAGPQLKVISTMSVGVDHIDLTECKHRNIKVGNTPNVSTNAVVELTVGLLIATARKFKKVSQGLCDGTAWDGLSEDPYVRSGPEIKGSTVGIVGLGRIGFAVARLLIPFGIHRLLYCGHKPKEYAVEINAEFVAFHQLLQLSDYVICCCSLNPENVKMFNSDAFSKMKKSAVFINVSRGDAVDQEALYEALSNDDIFAAGLDVTTPEPLPKDDPLLSLQNCFIVPHIGSNSINASDNMADLSFKNLLAGICGKALSAPLVIK